MAWISLATGVTVITLFVAGLAPGAYADPVDVDPTGDASARYVAASGLGNATCEPGDPPCVAASGAGDANASWLAASGLGDAEGGGAASGAGNASGCEVAISLAGDAKACRGYLTYFPAVSGTGNATGDLAVTLAGDADGGKLAVSLFGEASCTHPVWCLAVSGCETGQSLERDAACRDAPEDLP